ncbi:conserved hypothetical protein [Crenothrix polyspora]|uniref:Uncharacterized protein n=1 Tax=Crenothrix polyspora TaxID=360316 RepID=A0A1R4HDK4_9GAMM|nr:hypothetical protein [Crenothrix polyspora]SJM94296.1 conserved hypothetical protein [Crenothrix polyspora]
MNTIITKAKVILGITLAFTLADTITNGVQANVIKQSPIIAKLQKIKQPLSKETDKWMKRWVGTNLDAPGFVYNELSGTTEIYLKIRKIDKTDLVNGYKAYGTFVTGHGSSNPDSEIAYFNLAAILGHDDVIRPAVSYTLGKKAAQSFKTLLEKELTITLPGDRRHDVRIPRLLGWLTKPPLIGGLKAKKHDSYAEYKSMADIPPGAGRGGPFKTNPIIKVLQASNPQPAAKKKVLLQTGYTGDLLQLAREYSNIMTLDVIFQQWDRYNNTNVGLAKDDANIAHFYMTDNGGADMKDDLADITRNLSYFSRYNRKTITKLKQLYMFLNNPARGFLGYKNAESFVVDLGLYSELKPAEYVRLLKRNLLLLLKNVAAVERKYGNQAYLP